MRDELERPETVAPNELSTLVIALMKGVMYRERDAHAWAGLSRLQTQVQNHVAVMGLELRVDHDEGYAYLRSQPLTEEAEQALPRLIPRRPLTLEDSLLLVLLRRQLAEFDATSTETRLIVTSDDLASLMSGFLPETNDDAPRLRLTQASIHRVAKLGFLRELTNPAAPGTWEVQRILKAFVDAQWLEGLDEKLAVYRKHMRGDDLGQGDGGE